MDSVVELLDLLSLLFDDHVVDDVERLLLVLLGLAECGLDVVSLRLSHPIIHQLIRLRHVLVFRLLHQFVILLLP